MKKLTLILFLILLCSFGYAQSRLYIDSLKHELAIAKQDTSRVLIMNALANSYKAANT